MVAVNHLGFKNMKCKLSIRFEESLCVVTPNFMPIGQAVAETLRFFDFSKMADIRHLTCVIRV